MESLHPAIITPTDARCLTCGYMLRGLEARRCPECGRVFDPGDLRTMQVGPPVGRLGRWLLTPVGRGTDALAYGAAAALLWGEGWLPGGLCVTMLGFTLCTAYLGWCFIRATARLTIALNRRRAYSTRRQRRPALVLGLAVLLCLFAVPQWLVLWLHQPLLQRHVKHIHAEMPLIEAEARARRGMIGLLYVHDTYLSPSSVRLVIGPRGVLWFDDAGDHYEWSVVEPVLDSFWDVLRPSNWRWRWWR